MNDARITKSPRVRRLDMDLLVLVQFMQCYAVRGTAFKSIVRQAFRGLCSKCSKSVHGELSFSR